MNRFLRVVTLFATSGLLWCISMQVVFVYSGAQTILAGSGYQSSKFLKVFFEYQPLPRVASDGYLLWKGFWVCGLFAAATFLFLNTKLNGNWIKRGVIFGLLHSALMIPWFEFYLPYNVMNEPLALVMMEAALWFATLQLLAIYMSFVINFRAASGGLQINKAPTGK